MKELKDKEIAVGNAKIGLSTKICMTLKTFAFILIGVYSALVTYGYSKNQKKYEKNISELGSDVTEMNSKIDEFKDDIHELELKILEIKSDIKVISERDHEDLRSNVYFTDNEPPSEINVD